MIGIYCVLFHPSDGEALKHFNRTHSNFSAEPRNARLSLCANEFSPFSQYAQSYSNCLVIETLYNLPPDMCTITPCMFLTCIIFGPTNPKNKIDVYLQHLIDELKRL